MKSCMQREMPNWGEIRWSGGEKTSNDDSRGSTSSTDPHLKQKRVQGEGQ